MHSQIFKIHTDTNICTYTHTRTCARTRTCTRTRTRTCTRTCTRTRTHTRTHTCQPSSTRTHTHKLRPSRSCPLFLSLAHSHLHPSRSLSTPPSPHTKPTCEKCISKNLSLPQHAGHTSHRITQIMDSHWAPFCIFPREKSSPPSRALKWCAYIYGVATISRLYEIIGVWCKRAL